MLRKFIISVIILSLIFVPVVASARNTASIFWTKLAGGEEPCKMFGVTRSPDGICVAVGDKGKIKTSADLIKWKTSTINEYATFYDIVWYEDRFITIGSISRYETGGNGCIYSSYDGQNWEKTVEIGGVRLYSIAVGNGNIVVVGNNGSIFYSQDGINWDEAKSGTDKKLDGIVYFKDRFVAIGYNGIIVTSKDSKTWTLQELNTTDSLFTVFCDSDKVYISCTYSLFYSYDATTWSELKSPDNFMHPAAYLFDACWNGETYLGIGDFGRISMSKDSMNWTNVTNPHSVGALSACFWDGTQYIIACEDGSILVSGVNETRFDRRSFDDIGQYNDVVWNGKMYVAVGSKSRISYSLDGEQWNQASITGDINRNDIEAVVWNGSVFVAGGSEIYVSQDGVNWQCLGHRKYYDAYGVKWSSNYLISDIIWDGTRFIGVGSNEYITSTDGLYWEYNKFFDNNQLKGIWHDHGTYIIVGWDGTIYRSTDFIEWKIVNAEKNVYINAIARNDNTYVAVSYYGHIYYSDDGTAWKKAYPGIAETFNDVIWDGKQFVAAGKNGVYLVSENGITWALGNFGTITDMNALCFNGSEYLCVGNNAIYKGIKLTDSSKKVGNRVEVQIGNSQITVNSVKKPIDQAGTCPVIINNQTMLPVRAVAEALGGVIEWDSSKQKITVTLNGSTVELWIGSNIAFKNGVQIVAEVSPLIYNQKTMVPLRFITENLGCKVTWDKDTYTAIIEN